MNIRINIWRLNGSLWNAQLAHSLNTLNGKTSAKNAISISIPISSGNSQQQRATRNGNYKKKWCRKKRTAFERVMLKMFVENITTENGKCEFNSEKSKRWIDREKFENETQTKVVCNGLF